MLFFISCGTFRAWDFRGLQMTSTFDLARYDTLHQVCTASISDVMSHFCLSIMWPHDFEWTEFIYHKQRNGISLYITEVTAKFWHHIMSQAAALWCVRCVHWAVWWRMTLIGHQTSEPHQSPSNDRANHQPAASGHLAPIVNRLQVSLNMGLKYITTSL